MDTQTSARPRAFIAALPFIFFASIFLGVGLAARDFYAVPVLMAFILTALFSFAVFHRNGLNRNLEIFCREAGDSNIIMMVLIFLLAGSFGVLAKQIGAVEATVNLCLALVPGQIVVAGIFLVCCFISLSIGTSVGTVVAMAPIALGLVTKLDVNPAICLSAVVGGAMFGDNLSSISDTTIAAVRTQGCDFQDKFKANFFLVLPAAILAFICYCFVPVGHSVLTYSIADVNLLKVVPYIVVIVGALTRLNVFALLLLGSVLCAAIGIADGSFSALSLIKHMHSGMMEMEDLAILSIVAAGTSGLIKANGGLDPLLARLHARVASQRGGEFAIALLVSAVNLFTANNTVAIVVAGPIAREIAEKFGISGKRSASILDIFASVIQGVIPYGAQVLAAASLGQVSPLALLPYSFYPYLMGICALVAIGFPRNSRSARHSPAVDHLPGGVRSFSK